MRTFILTLGSLELFMFLIAVISNLLSAKHTDAAGEGMAYAYAIIFIVVLILFLIPALLLAGFGKLLWLALILLILATLCLIASFMFL